MYSKHSCYWEYYALKSLELIGIVPMQIDESWLQDRPDIQIPDLDMGIEVTRAIISDIDGQYELITRELLGRHYSYEEAKARLKKIDKNETFTGELFCLNNGSSFGLSPTRGLFTPTPYYKVRILSAISKKVEKRKKGNYTLFAQNGLYIFLNTSLLSGSAMQTMINDSTALSMFDVVFVDCMDAIFEYRSKAPCYSEYHLSSDDMKKINELSKSYTCRIVSG
jgi:hypothetical protein